MGKKGTRRKRPLTYKQSKAIEQVIKHPDKSNAEISKDLIALGVVKDINYLQTTTGKNKNIRDKIAIYRESFELRIARKGRKVVNVIDYHLNNNNLKAALGAAKLIAKQDEQPTRQPMIHVDTLNIVQGNQLIACQDKLDAVEVQESGNDNE